MCSVHAIFWWTRDHSSDSVVMMCVRVWTLRSASALLCPPMQLPVRPKECYSTGDLPHSAVIFFTNCLLSIWACMLSRIQQQSSHQNFRAWFNLFFTFKPKKGGTYILLQLKHSLAENRLMTSAVLIWFCQRYSALEARYMRPVEVCVTGRAVLCLGLRLAVKRRKCVRRVVSVPLESIWVILENVWQLTCAPACMMDSSTNLMTSLLITTASGQWMRALSIIRSWAYFNVVIHANMI